MTYFDPGAGSLLIQAIGGLIFGWLATVAKVREFISRKLLRRKKDKP